MPGFSIGVAGSPYDNKEKRKTARYSNSGSRNRLPPASPTNKDLHVSSGGCRGVAWESMIPWLFCTGVWIAAGFIFYVAAMRNRTCDECPTLNSR